MVLTERVPLEDGDSDGVPDAVVVVVKLCERV